MDFCIAAEHFVVACGGLNGNLDRVRKEWDPGFGKPPDNLLNGSDPSANGFIHNKINLLGGKLTHLNQMWNYAAGIRHPQPKFEHHGLSLLPPRSALWMDCYGNRVGPDPMMGGFNTHKLCQRLIAGYRPLPVTVSWRLAAIAADQDTPIMVRATAVSLLANIQNGETVAKLDTLYQAKDGHPLMRIGATRGVAGLSPQRQWQLLSPLLEDEHLAVRSAAFLGLLGVANDPDLGQHLRPYLPDYLESQALSLDFPETQVNIANAHAAFGEVAAAESALREAVALQASFIPALLNLAELYRVTERDAAGEELLKTAMATVPGAAAPVFSYAMWLTRQQRPAVALELPMSWMRPPRPLPPALGSSATAGSTVESTPTSLPPTVNTGAPSALMGPSTSHAARGLETRPAITAVWT